MTNKTPVFIRFHNWTSGVGNEKKFLKLLLEKVLNRDIHVVESFSQSVDIQFESVYKTYSKPKFSTRLYRYINSNRPGGIDFSNQKHSTNQQPIGRARFNIFYTGENERPPEGIWDAYLSFDLHSFGGRNVYLPLWWITSSDLLFPKTSPYLGKEIKIKDLMQSRTPNYNDRRKFCIAFIGKDYPIRMHAITALSKVGKIDVFGAVARNTKYTQAINKYDLSQEYRFVLAFENDLYPGYVTEKPIEAWATGAVPLYWGLDPAGYINQNSLINMANFNSMEAFVERVAEVNGSRALWEAHASQPLLSIEPTLDNVIVSLRRVLSDLL